MITRLEETRTGRARRHRRVRRRLGALAAVLAAAAAALALVPGPSSKPAHGATRSSTRPASSRLRAVAGGRVAGEVEAVRRLAAFGLPLFCGGRAQRVVAFTFDDGPGVYTNLAIKKLREHRLRATFFLVGKEVRAFPNLVPRLRPVAAFGDHTMTHPFLPGLGRAAMVSEIAGARALIERATHEPALLFRPPYEARTPAVDREVKALGMLEVLWNVDSRDSLGANYAAIARNVIAGLRPGSIILMHENRGQTIRALPRIFAALDRDHLRALTIPQLLAEDPPSLAQLRKGLGGCAVSLQTGGGD
jgi:peptidoglycan/xylan/chitin deacetylase (PgdA/CDA1 family)